MINRVFSIYASAFVLAFLLIGCKTIEDFKAVSVKAAPDYLERHAQSGFKNDVADCYDPSSPKYKISSTYCKQLEKFKSTEISNSENNEKLSSYILKGRNYSLAIYNNQHRLLTNPIADLMSEMKWRFLAGQDQITDIYLVSHGWNYTLSTALANYHNYIEMIDNYMIEKEKEKQKSFQPYFILVTWTSSVRPFTEFAKGVLPFGIDIGLEPLTSAIDKIPLHLITGWKESLNAAHNALGARYPNYYLDKSWEWGSNRYLYYDNNLIQDADNLMGNPLPLSALIYELIQKKVQEDSPKNCDPKKLDRYSSSSDKCVPLTDTRIHLIGHSYGAKLITMGGMEALRRWNLKEKYKDKDSLIHELAEGTLDSTKKRDILESTGHKSNVKEAISKIQEPVNRLRGLPSEENIFPVTSKIPIESLVLFNPAFHPSELSYPVDDQWLAPIDALKFIPRKAIVYSKNDYPNGALFGLREAFLNMQSNQRIQHYWSNAIQNFYDENEISSRLNSQVMLPNLFLSKVSQTFLGTLHIGYNFLWSIPSYIFPGSVNLVSDALYHMENGSLDGRWKHWNAKLVKYPVNLLDFFLPIKITRLGNNKFGCDSPLSIFDPNCLFFYARDEADQGFFRISKPGLGKTGLKYLAEGRWWKSSNLNGLDMFDLPDIDAEKFEKFTSSNNYAIELDNSGELLQQRNIFYSLDASKIYNSMTFVVGAHGDLRDIKGITKSSGIREDKEGIKEEAEKRRHTFNFVLRFTKTNFWKSEEFLKSKENSK